MCLSLRERREEGSSRSALEREETYELYMPSSVLKRRRRRERRRRR